MSRSPAARQDLNGWPTRRFELLKTRVCDLPLDVEESLLAPALARVRREIEGRGLGWFPEVYFSTGWHCPDRVAVIGMPFTLATRELRRLEKEVTGEVESAALMVKLLRHEMGHAYNYVLRLHESKEWRSLFGPISRPYRERYAVTPNSRRFVRHLRRHYSQKHPDDDFAETFAVWLTPRARWRRRYAGWGALDKLEYVDRVMREASGRRLTFPGGDKVDPVEELTYTVAQHFRYVGYPVHTEGLAEDAAYFDEDLRTVFAGPRAGGAVPAAQLLRRLRRQIVARVVALLGVRPTAAGQLYDKYVERAHELVLEGGRATEPRVLVGVTTMMTTHLLNRKGTGRFTGPHRLVTCR